jgi:hypothetical protein
MGSLRGYGREPSRPYSKVRWRSNTSMHLSACTFAKILQFLARAITSLQGRTQANSQFQLADDLDPAVRKLESVE